MLIGAILGASFILLLVVCEAASCFLWSDRIRGARTYYCPACDLRYTRDELADLRGRTCRKGHAIQQERRHVWTVALITACLTFIAIGVMRLETGLGQ